MSARVSVQIHAPPRARAQTPHFLGAPLSWVSPLPSGECREEESKGQEASRTSYGHAVGGLVHAAPTAPCTRDPDQVHLSLDLVLPEPKQRPVPDLPCPRCLLSYFSFRGRLSLPLLFPALPRMNIRKHSRMRIRHMTGRKTSSGEQGWNSVSETRMVSRLCQGRCLVRSVRVEEPAGARLPRRESLTRSLEDKREAPRKGFLPADGGLREASARGSRGHSRQAGCLHVCMAQPPPSCGSSVKLLNYCEPQGLV